MNHTVYGQVSFFLKNKTWEQDVADHFINCNMNIQLSNQQQVLLRRLLPEDIDNLLEYLNSLSHETKKRFGPHAYEKDALIQLYTDTGYCGYVAINIADQNIVAYAIIKKGYLQHDKQRLESYGLQPGEITDCVFAPSVSDAWQGCGLGNALLAFITAELKAAGISRIILWGGVQADNKRAVSYYLKNGFTMLGTFEYYGSNHDMLKEI